MKQYCKCGCGEELDFTTGRKNKKYKKGHFIRVKNHAAEARKGNAPWNKGIPRTEKEKKVISKAIKIGKQNSDYIHTEEHKRKISEALTGRTKTKEWIEKIINSRDKNKNWRKNIRKSVVADLRNKKCSPNYNINSIPILEQKAKELGITDLQHAENGGEFFIKELGYWVDGYSKEKNIVIEYYEKKHKYQREQDLERQQEIQKLLNCKFVIIYEK